MFRCLERNWRTLKTWKHCPLSVYDNVPDYLKARRSICSISAGCPESLCSRYLWVWTPGAKKRNLKNHRNVLWRDSLITRKFDFFALACSTHIFSRVCFLTSYYSFDFEENRVFGLSNNITVFFGWGQVGHFEPNSNVHCVGSLSELLKEMRRRKSIYFERYTRNVRV